VNDVDGKLEDLRSSTIVMVDDEPTTIEVLEMFLQSEGYGKIVAITDSRRTLDLLAERRPDVLLLNLMMPNVSGFEILRSMRKDEVLRRIPVIVLTSSTDAETKRAALELGASDFLGKPVDPSELTLRLRNTLAARAYRDRLEPVRAGRDSGERDLSGARPSHARGAAVVSRLAGTGPRLRAVIERFVGRLEEKLEEMEASWETGNFDELASLAHWLRGAAGTVGFDAFTGPAGALKLRAEQRKEDEIEESIRELRALAERIVVSDDAES
jgi:CheY-like chemotaxis protein